MQIYLVGGAVRDQLLGLPVKERDWVVVGATPDQMLQQGFKPVGQAFPVFLHPKTKEEYALARKERKTAPGYRGFACEADPAVTLEEDLLRRDLTINAMAMDEDGTLIDPFGGQQDLTARLLRQVSPAFEEDPVRVLRLARFKARFHSLGFQLAPETRCLVYRMGMSGELAHLVPERVWQEWARSLETLHPEEFIALLRETGTLSVLMPELDVLFGIPAAPKYHPEIDSGVHTLAVLKMARSMTSDPLTLFAALLHDLGKAMTPKQDWPSHPEHDRRGEAVIISLCERLKVPRAYREAAVIACRYHLDIYRAHTLPPARIIDLLMGCSAYQKTDQFERLLRVCEADARAPFPERVFEQAAFWRACLERSAAIEASPFIEAGMQGVQIRNALYQARVEAVKTICEGESDEK